MKLTHDTGAEAIEMVTREEAEDAVHTLLGYLEPDPNREGLAKTPKRVIDSWDEIFGGYQMDAAELLDSTFNGEGYDGIVLLRDIEFHSTCEHHLQPFNGRAHVAYIPVDTDRWAFPVSLARLIDRHARRLHRIRSASRRAVADDLEANLERHWEQRSSSKQRTDACGAAVFEKQNSIMTTSAMRGVFFERARSTTGIDATHTIRHPL